MRSQVLKRRVREPKRVADFVAPGLRSDDDEFIRVGNGQRTMKPVLQTKNSRVGADAERNGRDHYDRHALLSNELAKSVVKVLAEVA
jgi:hypothetical protein